MRKLILILLLCHLFGLDYSLEDMNTTSSTYGESVGPSYFIEAGKSVSINYFGWETWGGWIGIFAQLCDLSNTGAWDTDKAVFIGVGKGLGGDSGLNNMTNQTGVNSPFVQDLTGSVWEDFLGDANAPRKQIVLLDEDLNSRYVFQYSGGSLNNSEVTELLNAIQVLVDELSVLLGDLNGDQNLNVLDVILLVNMALGILETDLNGDMNQDGGVNILDVVLLVNIILET